MVEAIIIIGGVVLFLGVYGAFYRLIEHLYQDWGIDKEGADVLAFFWPLTLPGVAGWVFSGWIVKTRKVKKIEAKIAEEEKQRAAEKAAADGVRTEFR